MEYKYANIYVLDNGEPVAYVNFTYNPKTGNVFANAYKSNIKNPNLIEIVKYALLQNEYCNDTEFDKYNDDIYFDIRDVETIKEIEQNHFNNQFKFNAGRK